MTLISTGDMDWKYVSKCILDPKTGDNNFILQRMKYGFHTSLFDNLTANKKNINCIQSVNISIDHFPFNITHIIEKKRGYLSPVTMWCIFDISCFEHITNQIPSFKL